jgi:hypothetical protein
MNKLFFKYFARAYATWVHRLERKIGYRLKFAFIPEPWINGWMIFDITRRWARHGIKAYGVNYFTVGSLSNNLSTRFIRDQIQYQSWLGAYLVKFKNDKDFTLQDHFNLAIADQKNWLESFGDSDPFIEMTTDKVSSKEEFSAGSYKGILYEFSGGPSHSDVGNKSVNLKTRFMMSVMAEVINLSNPKLKLSGKNFLPVNTSNNYETVILKEYVAIVELEKNTKFVFYGNSTEILNIEGTSTDYFPFLKKEILSTFKSMSIEKVI